MNSMWFTVEHYHNIHSTQYRCTHYTPLSTAWCFQSVCSSVTPWCVILLSTKSSPLVHPPVHIPPPQGLSREMQTVVCSTVLLCSLSVCNLVLLDSKSSNWICSQVFLFVSLFKSYLLSLLQVLTPCYFVSYVSH
jgi:hypothetical protein